MRSTPTRRRPGVLFLSLALVLILHPASGAGQGEEGLGWLLSLFLPCSSCQADAHEEEGCCSEETGTPLGGCQCGCPCTSNVELPDQQPLSTPPPTTGSPCAALVLAHARISAATIDVPFAVSREPIAPPESPGTLRSWSGPSPFRLLAAGPNGLLAALCTARI